MGLILKASEIGMKNSRLLRISLRIHLFKESNETEPSRKSIMIFLMPL